MRFTFEDSEPVVGGVAAILTIPAQFLSQARGGREVDFEQRLSGLSSRCRTRVEAKLVAATKLYLATSPIAQIATPSIRSKPHRTCIDRGDGETALRCSRAAASTIPKFSA